MNLSEGEAFRASLLLAEEIFAGLELNVLAAGRLRRRERCVLLASALRSFRRCCSRARGCTISLSSSTRCGRAIGRGRRLRLGTRCRVCIGRRRPHPRRRRRFLLVSHRLGPMVRQEAVPVLVAQAFVLRELVLYHERLQSRRWNTWTWDMRSRTSEPNGVLWIRVHIYS